MTFQQNNSLPQMLPSQGQEDEALNESIRLYTEQMLLPRTNFDQTCVLHTALKLNNQPLLQLVLINFCSWGFEMTRYVEGWIKTAGINCEKHGFTELGKALEQHAKEEAGHEKLMVRDTHALVHLWNQSYTLKLNAEELLSRPLTPGVKRYHALHEEVVNSSQAFRQLSIEHEIERLSVIYAGGLVKQVVGALGQQTGKGLSFIRSHASTDIQHDKFNREQLANFLQTWPEHLPLMVETGKKALAAYSDFLRDCFEAARTTLEGTF